MSAKDKPTIESPTGLDLQPVPPKPARISKRASGLLITVAVVVLILLAYGGYKRAQGQTAAAASAGVPTNVTPATQAASEFVNNTGAGVQPSRVPPLHAPGTAPAAVASGFPSACPVDPRTNQPYRFNPETGQPCAGNAYAPAQNSGPVPYAPNLGQASSFVQQQQQPQYTPQQQAVLAAFKREQEAMLAPTSIRSTETAPPTASAVTAGSQGSDLALLRALSPGGGSPQTEEGSPALLGLPGQQPPTDGQSLKEAFFARSRKNHDKDYLDSTREAPRSPYEIKAGWDIPAVLEQALNSDLPGPLKALVMSNVYDTATGQYLLIPQGSRLTGKYDSHVSYGQDGVQVVWNRIIYPDASSIDLDGMEGLDSHGNAGLRDKVDHHYKRLVGMMALSSVFSAGLAISQYRQQSVLSYPTPGEMASSAVSEDLANSANQLTRKNINVQPTIKIPIGYTFRVRVDRDISFDAPYAPLEATQQQEGQAHHWSSSAPGDNPKEATSGEERHPQDKQ